MDTSGRGWVGTEAADLDEYLRIFTSAAYHTEESPFSLSATARSIGRKKIEATGVAWSANQVQLCGCAF